MIPSQFAARYGPTADAAARATGLSRWTILAQWAVETGWGTSVLCNLDNNLAGIRWYGKAGTVQIGGNPGQTGTGFAGYASSGAFLVDYIATMNLPYYEAVRSAITVDSQLRALGASPWDAGHYIAGGVVGGSLLAAWHLLPVPTASYELDIAAHATVDTFQGDGKGHLIDHRRAVWGPRASSAPAINPAQRAVVGDVNGWRPLTVRVTSGAYATRYVAVSPTHGVTLRKLGG